MKTVFISRDLNTDTSIFYKKLSPVFTISSQSLIELSLIPFERIPATDWIFFYSKNAVDFFFENIQNKSIHLSINQYKWAAIGKATGKKLRQHCIEPDFIGNGQPTTTAKLFLEKASKQKVLFPRASTSKKSIQKLLNDKIIALDLIIYHNQKKDILHKRTEDILVFTSPMNAQAYFEKYSLLSHQQLIAIGNTTASALKDFHFRNIIISKEPNELMLAKTVFDIM